MNLEGLRGRLFLTVAEAAELFDDSDERTVRRAIEDGQIPAVKVGTKTLIPVPRLLAMIEPDAPRAVVATVAADSAGDTVAAAREILTGALRAIDALTGYHGQNHHTPDPA